MCLVLGQILFASKRFHYVMYRLCFTWNTVAVLGRGPGGGASAHSVFVQPPPQFFYRLLIIAPYPAIEGPPLPPPQQSVLAYVLKCCTRVQPAWWPFITSRNSKGGTDFDMSVCLCLSVCVCLCQETKKVFLETRLVAWTTIGLIVLVDLFIVHFFL